MPRHLGHLALLLWSAGATALAVPVESAPAPVPAPLTVRDGRFFQGDRPFRGVGVNYFDGFRRLLEFPELQRVSPPPYREGLATLRHHGIPFARFAACGFYPVEWRLYVSDPDRYFALLDGFVDAAEAHGIGLIPSLFWSHFAVPDLMGEPISAWGNADSRTRRFMERYTRDVVTRYRGRSVIWAWEFGNEYLNEAGLAANRRPDYWVVPDRGTARHRTEADYPSHADIASAYRAFAKTVRELDAKRPIMTGDALPRSSAWHLARGQGWKPDAPAQWRQALAEANPDPIDTLSIHMYHPRSNATGYPGYGPAGGSLAETFAAALSTARATGKAVWLGEFGPGLGESDLRQRREQVDEFLRLLVKHQVDLSAYWVFDSLNPELHVWNTTPTNENAFVLGRLGEANRRLQPKAK